MAHTPHNQKPSHRLGSSPSTGPRAATSVSSGAVGGTQPATRAAMLAPAPASLQGGGHTKPALWGAWGRQSQGKKAEPAIPSQRP